MAKERTSVRMQAQIKIMSEQGHSIRSIARVLKLSRRTVRKYLESAPQPPSESGGWEEKIDWDYVRQEVYGKGTTVKQIGQEVAPEIAYVKFWRVFREKAGLKACPEQVTIRLHHKPAEKTQVDFSDGLWITERVSGKKTLTQFFLGVLPFSSYTFGEFVLDQKLSTFIAVQQRMFAYFGGVTPYLVVDNLKSGVYKPDLYDPDVNPTYCDFANHMGFAVLPARPYKPKDKGSGESNIGVVQRGFFQEVRNRVFYSLEELNKVLRLYLARLNHQVMKNYGVCRAERFEEEKKHLKPLPSASFEISEWRAAKVHPDCHIQVEKNFYSVPFLYVGQKLRVRLTDKMVEIFSEDSQPISAHSRLSGIGKFSTYDSHYPEKKLSVARFEVHHAQAQAAQLGPHVEKLVDKLLLTDHPLRHLRRVQGILRLAKRYPITAEALDHACQRALVFNKTRLAYIKDCALYFVTHGQRPTLLAPSRQADTVHLHQLSERAKPRRKFYENQFFWSYTGTSEKKQPPYFVYNKRSHFDRYLAYPPKQPFYREVLMMLDQVKNLSHQMRLFGIHQTCELRAAEALSQQLHPLEFLRLLLEEELLSRKDRTAKALVTKARFRFRADLEDLDLTFHKDLTKAKIKELSELSFLHNLENLLILGKTGLGKTHLAIALGKRLCQEGYPTQFLPVNFLFEEIQAAKAAGRYLNYVRSLIKAKVLILDDLGLRNYTHEEAISLMDILEERYHKAPLIITSQVEPQGWLKLFEDPVIGEAIVDRLIHPSQKITLKGDKSYREKLTENKSRLKNHGGLS